jgi:hypothetical protein
MMIKRRSWKAVLWLLGPIGKEILDNIQAVVGRSPLPYRPSLVVITKMLYPTVLEGGVLHLLLQISSNLDVCSVTEGAVFPSSMMMRRRRVMMMISSHGH